jgi:dolichol-phosphate mannosyltransferase
VDVSGADIRDEGVTVILPTLNEAGAIGALIHGTLSTLSPLTPVKVLVVDDGSTDGTRDIVLEAGRSDNRVGLLARDTRDGLAGALRDGVASAKTDVVVWMDADGSMDPIVLADLWRALQSGVEIAIGSRFVEGGGGKGSTDGSLKPWESARRLQASKDSITGVVLSRLLNVTLRWVLGNSVHDYTSGYIMCRRDVALRIGFRGSHGEYCIGFLHQAVCEGLRVREIPYVITPRKSGVSKTGTTLLGYGRRGAPYVQMMLSERHRERA